MTDMSSGTHSGYMGSAAAAPAQAKETGQTEGTQDSENGTGNGTTRHPLGLSRDGDIGRSRSGGNDGLSSGAASNAGGPCANSGCDSRTSTTRAGDDGGNTGGDTRNGSRRGWDSDDRRRGFCLRERGDDNGSVMVRRGGRSRIRRLRTSMRARVGARV